MIEDTEYPHETLLRWIIGILILPIVILMSIAIIEQMVRYAPKKKRVKYARFVLVK